MQVNGFAAGFESTGDQKRRAAASNFFDIIVGAHSYATGGNNDGEYWGPGYQLGGTIAAVCPAPFLTAPPPPHTHTYTTYPPQIHLPVL